MAAAEVWLRRLKNAGVFLLGRYPFFSVLLLLMILAERAPSDENIPPFNVPLLYGYLAIMAACGIGMAYDWKRLYCALIHACQLGYLAYEIYSNGDLNYKPWLQNRLICRCFGLAGVYVIYAFLTSRAKSRQIQKIGEGILALFTMASMFMLVNSPDDRALFISRIPLKTYSLFFLVTIMGACAMIYINGGLFVTDASQAMTCINLALVICVYADVNYWVMRRGVPFWVQMRIISDDVFISIGLFVMAFANIYWKKRLPKEDKDGNLYQHHSD